MRLDHLLSKESGTRELERAWRCGTRGRASGSILFNFEGPLGNSKEQTEAQERGGIAQLGEHLLCKQGVRSSSLLISTKNGLIAQVVRARA